jgi:hypothetical protein
VKKGQGNKPKTNQRQPEAANDQPRSSLSNSQDRPDAIDDQYPHSSPFNFQDKSDTTNEQPDSHNSQNKVLPLVKSKVDKTKTNRKRPNPDSYVIENELSPRYEEITDNDPNEKNDIHKKRKKNTEDASNNAETCMYIRYIFMVLY